MWKALVAVRKNVNQFIVGTLSTFKTVSFLATIFKLMQNCCVYLLANTDLSRPLYRGFRQECQFRTNGEGDEFLVISKIRFHGIQQPRKM